ncbi:hypothetical protein HDU85_007818 [Gaertneriomyces sp. JEL0708]|nr:hypothetical protein HDU85_007818 [Gaertneriomyces sp. JEL0708]
MLGRQLTNSTKLALTALYALVNVTRLFVAIANRAAMPPSSFVPIAVAVPASLVALLLLWFEQQRMRRASSILIGFWGTRLITDVLKLRTYVELGYESTLADFSIYVVIVGFSLILMLWESFFTEATPIKSAELQSNPSPEFQSNFFARITFSWVGPFIKMAHQKRMVDMEDIWDLDPCGNEGNVESFAKHWEHQCRKPVENRSVMKALLRTVLAEMILSGIHRMFYVLYLVVQPIILQALLDFLQSSQPAENGYALAVLLLLVCLLYLIHFAQAFYKESLSGIKIRAVLIPTIYEKTLKLPHAGNDVGKITNLMTTDVNKIAELIPLLHLFWIAPVQGAISLALIYKQLGWATFVGLGVLLFVMAVNLLNAPWIGRQMKKALVHNDKRMDLMTTLLSGMRTLKLYAWDKFFRTQIDKARVEQLKALRSFLNARTVSQIMFDMTPVLIIFATLATFAAAIATPGNPLTITKVLVCFALFDLIRMPLAMMAVVYGKAFETSVSFARVNQFLSLEELSRNLVTRSDESGDPIAVAIADGAFYWNRETQEPVLNDIHLEVQRGSLTAVIGAVGSGKSTLLSAILGEVYKASGTIVTNGRVAYVAQHAFMLNASVRENILFGKPFDLVTYDRVIEACALRTDIQLLQNGDATLIGDRGFALSGGQRQRISIARALYSNADIYIFDDCLSAVDAIVDQHIFMHAFGRDSFLKAKTRILATHALHHLPEVDNIVMLVDGRIGETGVFTDLVEAGAAFSDLIRVQLEEQPFHAGEGSSVSEDEEIMGVSEKRIESIEAKQEPAESHKPNAMHGKEQRAEGAVSASVYKKYVFASGKVLFPLATAAIVLSAALSMGIQYYINYWLQQVDAQIRVGHYLGGYGGLFAAFSVTLAIGYWTSLCALPIGASSVLHQTLLASIVRAPMSFFDSTPLGRILNRFGQDMNSVDQMIPLTLQQTLIKLINVIAVLVVTCVASWYLIPVILVVGISYYIIQARYRIASRDVKRLHSVAQSPLYQHFNETVNGVASVRAYGDQDRFTHDNRLLVDATQRTFFMTWVLPRWLQMSLGYFSIFITFVTALVAVILRDVSSNTGVMAIAITNTLSLSETLSLFVRNFADLETQMVSVERITEFSQLPSEQSDGQSPPVNWPASGEIEFRNYSTRYKPDMDFVLKDLSFTIPAGTKLGVVGRTGSGKSTLSMGLFRIIESAHGSIHIDGINIATVPLDKLRSSLTIIPQDPFLLTGTIRQNLDPFGHHDDDRIWSVLESVGLKAAVSILAAKLDTPITGDGGVFSVGQRQLLCLARAILRKTKILVMDEATSGIDQKTEILTQQTLKSVFVDCTVITIAHRINTIVESDMILVMDQGRVAEYGPPNVLLRRPGSLFASLYASHCARKETLS